MTSTPGAFRRPAARQARAVANDVIILDAIESVLAEDGWESASVLQIAEVAGISRRAVLNRYGDRSGAVAALWHDRLSDTLMRHLQAVLLTQSPLDHDAADTRLLRAVSAFINPDPTLAAAAEVLIISSYEPDAAVAVNQTLGPFLDAHLVPHGRVLTRAAAARRAFLLSLTLGILLESRTYPAGPDVDLTADLEVIMQALSGTTVPQRLPSATATHLDETPVLDDNPSVAAILAATLEQVGTHGYEAATIDRIARSCGATSGLIFGHYANKRELFLDATDRAIAHARQANVEFGMKLAEVHSPGIVDAVMTREFMDPRRHRLRTITLEQYRLAWHDPQMRAPLERAQFATVKQMRQVFPDLSPKRVRGRAFIALARGIGMGLLANLRPDAAALPHDVVSIPLAED